MTIAKARIIVSRKGVKLSDEQLQSLLDCFSIVIEVGLQQFEKKYIKKVKTNCNE